MNTYIVDACALIAYLKNEPGSNKIVELLKANASKQIVLYLHHVNLYEVYYDFYKSDSKEIADDVLETIYRLPFVFIKDITTEAMKNAGFFKSSFRVSMADSILLGQAKLLNAIVVTADHHEFDIIENNNICEFFWIR